MIRVIEDPPSPPPNAMMRAPRSVDTFTNAPSSETVGQYERLFSPSSSASSSSSAYSALGMKWEDMRTRDLQSALRKRGVDPSKFVMREEILAAIREATRGEEAAAAAHAATVGAALRRRVLLENLWLAAKWGSVALFVLFASTAGRPWIEGQYAQLTWWLATASLLRQGLEAAELLGRRRPHRAGPAEASAAHMSASMLASWVLPRGSLRKFMFPILPLSLDLAALLAATATPVWGVTRPHPPRAGRWAAWGSG